ncbi:hypothetical protein [uncultured Roseobacter sp.]|uniref:hypothetical protein n=1 Tax=uncultured Roseobacter sp. TaxID=114847 RepID=UPI00261AD593|nr:hypothetical protein [uncultured Roseobacter sp.]
MSCAPCQLLEDWVNSSAFGAGPGRTIDPRRHDMVLDVAAPSFRRDQTLEIDITVD